MSSSVHARSSSRSANEAASHSGPFVTRANGFSVIDCKSCGYRHVYPMPEADNLISLYAQDYYATTKPTYFVHAKEDEPWAQLAYDDRLDAMTAHLRTSERRLVDIGAGPGSFMAHAQACGWNVKGLEPSHQAAAYCRARELDVTEAFLSAESVAALGPADAVHLMNMLEHVPDAAATLELAVEILAPGGVLCVGVPNDYNPLQRLLSARDFTPWWVAPPHHLNYFDFDSLENLVRRVGLRPRTRLTSFPMELFPVFGRNYIGNDALGRVCHNERKRFDIDLDQAAPGRRRALYQALAEAGFGREAIVIATKD